MGLRSVSDYREQMRQLLPPGPAWEADFYPNFHRILDALSPEFVRIDDRALDLLNEMFPGTINELLPDWERVMGLPDDCMGPSSSFGERKQEVYRRFSAIGEQRKAYFISIANRFGYPDASINEWRAPRWGRSRFGASRFGSWGAQFVWELNLGSRIASGARFGFSVWGSRFGSNPNSFIECIIRRYAPAHTVVLFNYD